MVEERNERKYELHDGENDHEATEKNMRAIMEKMNEKKCELQLHDGENEAEEK